MNQYLLVAGVDYHFKGVNFRVFCNNRMKRILALNKAKKDLKFQIFDFIKGEIETHEVTYSMGKKIEKITKQTPYQSISKTNYDKVNINGEIDYHFKDGQTNVMSILDIYKAIQQIGVDSPNSLLELSFFSHGWMEGPVLVNSFDDRHVRIPHCEN